MTEVAYKGLTVGENIFKSVIWDNAVKAAEAALFTAVPFLAVWPLSSIVSFLIEKFTDILFSNLRLIVDLSAIFFVNLEHRKAYDAESLRLKALAKEKGIDSQEFKDEREKAKAALAKFLSFGGR